MAELKMPKRIETFELKEGYEGFWIKAWVNIPAFLYQEMTRNFLKALPGEKDSESGEDNRIIIDWNLVDFKGEKLEVSNEVMRKQVPIELVRQFVDNFTQEAAGLKKIPSGA